MDYAAKLNEAKTSYPFARWRSYEAMGMEPYTEANCRRATLIFDTLIRELEILGESATEADKIERFQKAVESLNALDDETGMIETGEREDLCELINVVTIRAGLDPGKYGDGEDLASQWRDW